MQTVQALSEINTIDLLNSLGLERAPGRALWEAVCRLPSLRFARQVLEYDQMVGELGMTLAAQNTLPGFVRKLFIKNPENVPEKGPVLFLSNHPGMTDTLALFAAIHRKDLKVVAGDRPFLRALPNTGCQLIFVGESSQERMGVVRAVTRQLRTGGAVLTFPAGHIEPDPALMPGAYESIKKWSESAALFARAAPDTLIVPVLVSGVIWGTAMNHPILRLRREREARERLGAALQLMIQTLLQLKPVSVQVQFGSPVRLEELSSWDPSEIMNAVTSRMVQLLNNIDSPGTSRVSNTAGVSVKGGIFETKP
jgi:1-acyl-sn-glycerol-3-phosphate acyltransferase